MAKTLVLDVQNFAHRCKAGFNNEGSSFLYKFVRNLRALVAEHKPDSMVFVKEGSPRHRYEIFKEYKGNRKVKEDDPKLQEKWAELMQFKEQVDEALKFCLKNLQVTVLRHGNLEADDLIAGYARWLANEKHEEVVVVSNDKDFAQLLWDKNPLIRVWDPGTKSDMKMPECDPVILKSLQGDKSDNIPGVQGFGPKKALQAACDPEFVANFVNDDFERNKKLVAFFPITEDTWRKVESISSKWDPAALMIDFYAYNFESLVKQNVLDKYYETFGGMTTAKLPMWVR